MSRALVAVVVLALAPAAWAADTVTTPYPGVTHIERRTATQKIHIVKVDLSLKTIRVRATRPESAGLRVDTFATRYGVEVAINADFFSATNDYKTSGLSMGAGERWTNTRDGTLQAVLAFGRDNLAALAVPAEVLDEPESWMSEIVSGRPLVVDDGVALDAEPPYSREGCDPHFCALHPRTAAGLSQDGQTLILATIDGRYDGAAGMTSRQVGDLMAAEGAWRALNLDGGGSTTLYVKNEGGVVNRPSDGCCRVVGNHLGIEIVEPFGDLTGIVRALDAAALAGAEVTVSTGATALTDAEGRYAFADVPAGDVTITATAPGYDPGTRITYVAAADTTDVSLELALAGTEPTAPDGGAGGVTMGGGCSVGARPRGHALATFALLALLGQALRGRGRNADLRRT